MTRIVTTLLSLLSLLFAASSAKAANPPAANPPAADAAAADKQIDFARDVAPIFQAHCVRCHHAAHKSGDLSLATFDDLRALSYVEPGKPAESHLLDVVSASPGKTPQMPKEGTPLTDAQRDVLRRWIVAGAAWPKEVVVREQPKGDKHWWSLQPIAHVTPPVVEAPRFETAAPANPQAVPRSASASNIDWTANPIDRFILAKLQEKKLEPSPPASKRELLRRATFDLTGLPPTPAQLADFENDTRPDAYERVIDRLLASPRYGERWGRHWLDVVRFGESRGFERNQIIDNLWPYRDYVIRSFNDDKPFDRFVREQIAGDVIGRDDPQVEVGSAFLTAGPYDDVGNQDVVAMAQIRADTLDEVIRTTSESFLGLTLGCARCHNHKFDPLLAADYYSLYATFAGVQHGERPVATAQARAAHEAKLKPLEAEKAALLAERAKFEKEIEARTKAVEAELKKGWKRPPVSRYGTEEKFVPQSARFVRLTMYATDSDDPKSTQMRLDEFEVWTAPGEGSAGASRNVALASAGGKASGAAREIQDFKNAYSADLVIDGKFGERWISGGDRLVIELAMPERLERVFFSSDRTKALDERSPHTTSVGEYRIETSLDGAAWTLVADSLDRVPASKPIAAKRLRDRVTSQAESFRLAKFAARLKHIDAELAALPKLDTWWVGKRQRAPGPFPIFVGGDPQKKGEPVWARSLSVFDELAPATASSAKASFVGYKLKPEATEEERRTALADWLAQAEHPLTSRVWANRIWHYHFGVGIVDTPSDFGYMGGKPTHPELLDYLARQLTSNGWHTKPLHRLIMTSQTYRQASTSRADAAALDGDSRLLWRFPPRRLSAEELRDTMLTVSGKLDLKMGGPGFRLYKYLQDNVATYVPLDEPGPETYRRAVYHQNARAARVDLMGEFDCPDNAISAPRRSATTTPLQALTLLNHKFTLDMAQAWADKLKRESPTDAEAQTRSAFLAAFNRPATDEEAKSGAAFIREVGLRAFCRAMLNANEFVYVR
jgi:mono/diheme cytochrome c family protein